MKFKVVLAVVLVALLVLPFSAGATDYSENLSGLRVLDFGDGTTWLVMAPSAVNGYIGGSDFDSFGIYPVNSSGVPSSSPLSLPDPYDQANGYLYYDMSSYLPSNGQRYQVSYLNYSSGNSAYSQIYRYSYSDFLPVPELSISRSYVYFKVLSNKFSSTYGFEFYYTDVLTSLSYPTDYSDFTQADTFSSNRGILLYSDYTPGTFFAVIPTFRRNGVNYTNTSAWTSYSVPYGIMPSNELNPRYSAYFIGGTLDLLFEWSSYLPDALYKVDLTINGTTYSFYTSDTHCYGRDIIPNFDYVIPEGSTLSVSVYIGEGNVLSHRETVSISFDPSLTAVNSTFVAYTGGSEDFLNSAVWMFGDTSGSLSGKWTIFITLLSGSLLTFVIYRFVLLGVRK